MLPNELSNSDIKVPRRILLKFTTELKAEAMKSIENIGVAKTFEGMRISSQTQHLAAKA